VTPNQSLADTIGCAAHFSGKIFMRLTSRSTALFAPLFAVALLVLHGDPSSAETKPATVPPSAKFLALPDRFRDLKMYSTSAADPKNQAAIVVTTSVRNEGKKPLDIHAELKPNPAAGFAGSRFSQKLDAGKSADWKYEVRPPNGFRRAVLQGDIRFGDIADRDLYVAVQGADPANFDDKRVEKITDRAATVGTYLPRIAASIRASRNAIPKPSPVLTLAANGTSKHRILLDFKLSQPRKPGQTLAQWIANPRLKDEERQFLEAVADLVRCIKLQSGAELVVDHGTNPTGPVIRLKFPMLSSTVIPDTFHISADAKSLKIEAADIYGLRQGVYTLLSDHLGCRWFQPGKIGEEFDLPADKTVRLPALDYTSFPSFFSSNGMSWSHSPHWDRWNRTIINGGQMTFGHCWVIYVSDPEFPYAKYPEMYARDPQGKIRKFDVGWSSTNFCPTNPKVIDVVAKKVNAYFKANPQAIVASLDPNDYAPMCQCERCMAMDKKFGQKSQKAEEVADRLLWFSNEVHKRLEPQFKDKYLGILIYAYQMELPFSVKPHDHHAAMICNYPPRYDHTRPFNDPTSAKNRDFHRLIKGWGSQLKQFGFYDYYGHYYYMGPWGIIHKIREDMPAFRDMGGTFTMMEAEACFASQGLNHYVASRLTWDVDADVDLILDEFYEKYYGPAEKPMRTFWEGAERRYALTRPGTHGERAAEDPEFWTELDGYLRQAEQAVAPTNVPQRFKDRVLCHRDGFDYGRKFHRLLQLAPHSPKHPTMTVAEKQEVLKILTDNRDSFAAIKKKYTTGDYWPPFISSSMWIDIDAKIDSLKKTGKFFIWEE
jgi:hypothetical protein